MLKNKLVGLAEIAQMANPPVSERTISNWRMRYDDFPLPLQTLQSGPVWEAAVVQAWFENKKIQAPVVISFINLKGGVAKTTTSIAVAEILAKEHRKQVLFIDLDPQTNATINLIGEDEWKKLDTDGFTLAQLFSDKLAPEGSPRFNIESSIVRGVSTIDGGIPRLHLLPSSIQLVELQDILPILPFLKLQNGEEGNPEDILLKAVEPILDRYDVVIIDCPPSLGTITKNGLKISSHYIIPTIPDIVSTWGVYHIAKKLNLYSKSINSIIEPLGIVATKVQGNIDHHEQTMSKLREGHLFGSSIDIKQPPLFHHYIRQNADTARGAKLTSLAKKYGPNLVEFVGLTKEIIQKCNLQKN